MHLDAANVVRHEAQHHRCGRGCDGTMRWDDLLHRMEVHVGEDLEAAVLPESLIEVLLCSLARTVRQLAGESPGVDSPTPDTIKHAYEVIGLDDMVVAWYRVAIERISFFARLPPQQREPFRELCETAPGLVERAAVQDRRCSAPLTHGPTVVHPQRRGKRDVAPRLRDVERSGSRSILPRCSVNLGSFLLRGGGILSLILRVL
mmetsp:Transcript_11912/g.27629  ORF Transcript_11912/g.27629 Transcript_11912/m.27629 type:complete len:204 (-) Transcript_11912:81-692(-)